MKMNNMLENHPRDTREPLGNEPSKSDLNILQDVLEESIGSFEIQNPQNIYDEEFGQILRLLEFSRGLKNHQVVIAPDGIIRFLSPKFPSALLLEIHNALVGIVGFDAPEENL